MKLELLSHRWVGNHSDALLLSERYPKLETYEGLLDPACEVDNRTAIRALMLLLAIPATSPTYARVVECYDDGWYKFFDGKSHPIPCFRLPSYLKRMKWDKDPFSMPHDKSYFTGRPEDGDIPASRKRLLADREYKVDHLASGERAWAVNVETWALRRGAWVSWSRHDARRASVMGYGTLVWLKTATPETLKKYGFQVPG